MNPATCDSYLAPTILYGAFAQGFSGEDAMFLVHVGLPTSEGDVKVQLTLLLTLLYGVLSRVSIPIDITGHT